VKAPDASSTLPAIARTFAAVASTSATLSMTLREPSAACWTLRAISFVATPCSSTAAAMLAPIVSIRRIVSVTALIALTASSVSPWMPEM